MQRTPAQRVHGRAPRGVVDLAADHLGAGPRPPRSSERFELVESGTLGRADAMMESTAGEACILGQRIGVRGRGEVVDAPHGKVSTPGRIERGRDVGL